MDTVRRDALRAAAEARRRLSEAEEQVRAAEEDWNFARAQFGRAAAEEDLDEDPLRASAAASKAATLINRALAAPGRR